MADFKPGDMVKLRSGGPKMTISWMNSDFAFCEWLDKGKSMHRKFKLVSLRHATPSR